MEITVISKTTDRALLKQFGNFDKVMDWVDGAARIGEVYMTSVSNMAANVLAKAAKTPVSRLNILAHGSFIRVLFGNDLIEVRNFRKFEPSLMLLRGRFANNAFVHFQICDVGLNLVLLQLFAKAFGVPVVAGAGAENTLFRFNWKNYVKCDPSGACTLNVKRP